MVQEARQYWESVLEGVDKPLAREMMAQLDLRYWLGIPQKTKIGQSKKAPLMPFFLSVKKEHPTKVLLVRVRTPVFLRHCCALLSFSCSLAEMMLRYAHVFLLTYSPLYFSVTH